MYGVVTRNAEEVEWPEFDRAFYEVKSVSGRHSEPVPGSASAIACFGDTATAETEPDLVPVDDEGNHATRASRYFDWGYVCPSETPYREGLLETVADAAAATGDIRLDEVGFPRDEFCRCDRCERAFRESDHDDWTAWRAATVTEFVEAAAEGVDGRLSVTLYPDPYPGRLYERSGIDLDALADLVDEFVVPLYDTAYGTTYWLEAMAGAFDRRLETPLAVELYAVEPAVDALVDAAEVVTPYADSVLFGYDASNAQAALRRMRADENEGATYRPD
jgi:hypothetical protein